MCFYSYVFLWKTDVQALHCKRVLSLLIRNTHKNVFLFTTSNWLSFSWCERKTFACHSFVRQYAQHKTRWVSKNFAAEVWCVYVLQRKAKTNFFAYAFPAMRHTRGRCAYHLPPPQNVPNCLQCTQASKKYFAGFFTRRERTARGAPPRLSSLLFFYRFGWWFIKYLWASWLPPIVTVWQLLLRTHTKNWHKQNLLSTLDKMRARGLFDLLDWFCQGFSSYGNSPSDYIVRKKSIYRLLKCTDKRHVGIICVTRCTLAWWWWHQHTLCMWWATDKHMTRLEKNTQKTSRFMPSHELVLVFLSYFNNWFIIHIGLGKVKSCAADVNAKNNKPRRKNTHNVLPLKCV